MIKNKVMILVSNPGKQYTHQLLNALQKNNFTYKFITSVWYKPNSFPYNLLKYFPKRIKETFHKEFLKRYDDKVLPNNVIQFPYFEIFREMTDKIFGQKFSERMQYFRDRFHDRKVSSHIKNIKPNIVIGYEESCVETFRQAKKMGLTTVLDLAQIHYNEITSISNKFSAFKMLYKNADLRNKINKIKEEELLLADYIICLSDWAKESLVKNNIPIDKIFVANLGFDPTKFLPKTNYTSQGMLKALFVGTLTKRKGIDVLIKLSEELQNVLELTLVGPLADANQLIKKDIKFYRWHPYVNHEELNKLYQEADLFIFPSYLDSWAMVVIEAMATGLPVIVTENTGSKEAVGNDCGFVIPAGDIKTLKSKIEVFIDNRQMLSQMGMRAKDKALQYTWDNYYNKINQIIDKIMSNEKQK
jgi:glycosyltransferase involved in cell wall biosynthesis